MTTSADDTPWPGLRPLEGDRTDHRRLLELTRSDELHAINNMVNTSRVSLLYAMSGNGKTSVLHAGVAPAFRRAGHVVIFTRPRPPWARENPRGAFRSCIARQLPGEIGQRFDAKSLDELQAAVAGNDELDRLAGRLRSFIGTLPSDPDLPRRFEQRLAAAGPSAHDAVRAATEITELPFVIVCDQFEELFVHYANEAALNEFIEDLGRIWSDKTLKVRLLFSMREDWVGSMIALRRTIPEMFRDYYRLQPITGKAAEQILKFPLEKYQEKFDPAAIRQIIADLSDAYTTLESRILGHVEPDPAGDEPQLLELPALLLVARKMWETRETTIERRLSLKHYQSLRGNKPSDAVTPAAYVLETYLDDELDDKNRDLQLDALYELTDHERHRRAASLDMLEREIRKHRHAPLYPKDATKEEIRGALDPLEARGLVRSTEVRGGMEYELAHDFLVRAVARTWRRLDRKRAEDKGRLAAEQERKEKRLASLEKRDDRTTLILQIAPLVGLFGLLWAAINLFNGDLSALGVSIAQPRPGLLMFLAFAALGVAAVISRHPLSIVMSAIAMVAGVVTIIWLSDPALSTQDILAAQRRGAMGGLLLMAICAVLFILCVRSEASLLPEENPWQKVLMIMFGEAIDFATYLPAAIPMVMWSWWRVFGWKIKPAPLLIEMGGIAFFVIFIVRTILSRRFRSSPGMRSAGFRVQSASRLYSREILVAPWSLVSLFAVFPWILGAVLIRSTGRTVPDWMVRTTLVDADKATETATTESAVRDKPQAR